MTQFKIYARICKVVLFFKYFTKTYKKSKLKPPKTKGRGETTLDAFLLKPLKIILHSSQKTTLSLCLKKNQGLTGKLGKFGPKFPLQMCSFSYTRKRPVELVLSACQMMDRQPRFISALSVAYIEFVGRS